MKRELQVGDRVRVVGPVAKGEKCIWANGDIERIESIDGDVIKGVSGWHFHRRQITKILVRKKPCPPQGERQERWLWEYVTGDFDAFSFTDEEQARGVWEAKKREGLALENEVKRFVHLVELKPGERIITKEALAKAWDSSFGSPVAEKSEWFTGCCKALGLEAK